MTPCPSAQRGNELKTLLLMAIGFGLVGLDRFIINPLFPFIAKDLALDYRDMGLISGALAVTWGIAAFMTGRVTGRFGLVRTLAWSALAFSALFGVAGLATGLFSLTCLRALTGLAEGAFVPASIVATSRSAHPSRIGFNIGLMHLAFTLFAFGLAPLLATRLIGLLPSWRWVFLLVAIPGFVISYCIYRFPPQFPHDVSPAESPRTLREILKLRPVLVNSVVMGCRLSGASAMGVFLPSYLIVRHGLGPQEMGTVLSGLGFGSVLGLMTLPALGDRFGYRLTALAGTGASLLFLGMLCLSSGGVESLFPILFLLGTSGAGVTAIVVGPLTGGAVPSDTAAAATGVVVGLGEIFGGALSPILAGFLAHRYGIAIIPVYVLGLDILGYFALLRNDGRTSFSARHGGRFYTPK